MMASDILNGDEVKDHTFKGEDGGDEGLVYQFPFSNTAA